MHLKVENVMTMYSTKNTEIISGITGYTLYGNDLSELKSHKDHFLKSYEMGYCGRCSDPIMVEDCSYFDEGENVYAIFLQRWTSCN